MAEGQVSLSSFKDKFTDQLTCSVCLDQYTNPKILPCHHSFCLTCIEPIPVELKDGKYYISCPACRDNHLLPQGGANSFPNDFKINNMLELQKSLVTTPKQKLVSTGNPSQSTCSKHNDLLKVYCETCDQVICRDCTISTEHNKHTFYLVSECYPKHHQQIMDNLHPVKHKLADIDTAMTHLATREREVLQQGEEIKEQINQHAQQLIDSIQRSQTHLTQQVDTIVQQKTQTLATQKQQAQKIHTQLQTSYDTIEHNLKEWTQQQILAQKHTMINEIDTQHIDPIVFLALEKANIEFRSIENAFEIGVITSETYSKTTLELSPCLAKQSSIASLTLQSQDGLPFPLPSSLISSTLSSPGNKDSVKCPITQTQPGKFNITFTAMTTQDQLMIQVGGVDVPESPFTLPVTPTPDMRREPVNVITGLHQPYSIAVCDNGDIVVAEQSVHRITILDRKGRRLKSFGEGLTEGTFTYPRGVAFSCDGHILVTDDHRLQKLTTDGVCVKSIGTRKSGSTNLHFNTPNGITVHHTTGQIFVADSVNSRIQIFANDLTFSNTITLSGIFRRFTCPYDVALDNEGYLYFAELGNYKITKLSDKGKYIKRFCSKENVPDQSPLIAAYLSIHQNLVYVSEGNNKLISVFDTDGKLLTHIDGGKILCFPCGTAIDTLGYLYVSDCNRIVVF